MNNYRKKLEAPLKKHAQLLAEIQANQQEALLLHDGYQARPADEQQFDINGFGCICKDTNIYSSLPPIGSEDDFNWQYIIDEDEKPGKGGSALVFKGRRLSDNKKVAIKKVNEDKVYDWGRVNGELYPIEYCHLRMVDGCSRIANLLDAFYTGDEYIFILETMDSCSALVDRLLCSQKPLEEPQCKLIFRQLVEAVDHCHKSGIFHRDIKLHNIVMDNNSNEIKLIDFDTSALSLYSPFMDNPGTHGYMAPEMHDSSAKYEGSPAAVYSIGVVLYDMIFHTIGWQFVYKRQPMPKVSLNCLDLICKMTASRPEDRLPFDQILHHPWMQS
jgi:serine/threonine protein kinase